MLSKNISSQLDGYEKQNKTFVSDLVDLKAGKVKSLLLTPDNSLQIIKAELKKELDEIIIGQDKAKETLLNIIGTRLIGNLPSEAGPLGVVLFVGPTGVGKTSLAEALAEILLGRKDRRILIPCETLVHGHEVANFIGAPQGYIGHGESTPFLSSSNVYRHYYDAKKDGSIHKLVQDREGFSIVVIDEFEKAHPLAQEFFLNIFEKGILELSTGREDNNNRSKQKHQLDYDKTTYFDNTIFICTSNAGSTDFMHEQGKEPLGFIKNKDEITKIEDLEKYYQKKLKKVFSAPILSRVNKNICVFEQLTKAHTEKIIKKIFRSIEDTELGQWYPLITINPKKSIIDFLKEKGFDKEFGARSLNTVIDNYIRQELNNYTHCFDNISHPVILNVSYENGKVVFELVNNNNPLVEKLKKAPNRINNLKITKVAKALVESEVILPLDNGLLITTIERINGHISNFNKLYRDRELVKPDFEIQLSTEENNLKKFEFSDNDIKILKLDIINDFFRNLEFIGSYDGFDFSEFDNIYSPYNDKILNKLLKNLYMKSKNNRIQDIYFEIEDVICRSLQKTYLNKKQIRYLIILIHKLYLDTDKGVLI